MKNLILFFFLIPSVLSAQYLFDFETGSVFDWQQVPPGRREVDSRDAITLQRLMRNDAVWGDVVINEIMCDPEPEVLLPACEYIEIYHGSRFPLDLEGWRLEVNGRGFEIGSLKLGPGEYAVLGGPRIVELSGPATGELGGSAIGRLGGSGILEPGEPATGELCGPVIGELPADRVVPLFASSGSLPNKGAEVALYDNDGTLIHVVRYADPGNGEPWKQEGGWSLESADPGRPCNTSRLWAYSEDERGGTPGERNSIFNPAEDREPPRFLYMGHPGPGAVSLHFSELVRFDPEQMRRAYLLPPGVRCDSLSAGNPYFDHVTLHFPRDLPEETGAILWIPPVSDCSGNLCPEMKIPVGRVSDPQFSSVQINEIMYDPAEGCPEFIELVHPGNRFHELGDIRLDVKAGDGLMDRLVPLCEGSRILAPGEYVVLTRHPGRLRLHYALDQTGLWIEMKEMPSLTNGGGTIFLADRSGNVIEMVQYRDEMHMPIMDETRGISLERISHERPGTDPGNWHSAASAEGYATPGRKNSQSLRETEGGNGLRVDPPVFSPDLDDYEDFLQISPGLEGTGWVIRLWVTDLKGNMVRQLANNHVTGPSSVYTWDGREDDGRMTVEGIWVVHLSGYHPATGKRFRDKAAAGIIYR